MLGEGYRLLVAYAMPYSLIKYTDVSDERSLHLQSTILP